MERLTIHKRCAITAESDTMLRRKYDPVLGCESTEYLPVQQSRKCRDSVHWLDVQGDNTPATTHVESANNVRQPTLINTFGQVRAPVRSFQTAIKEQSTAEQHFVTF